MRIGRLLVTGVLVLTAGCTDEQKAPQHVPGQPMTYPVDAVSTLENLAKGLRLNCESADQSIQAACMARFERRMESCGKERPAVLRDREHHREVSNSFMQCLMPNPICKGIEIKSEYHFNRYCKGGD